MHGLELRNKELDFYMIRFAMTAGLSSIMTCLSYVGLIKIKIPEPMHEGFYWPLATFYVCTSLSMVLSLYNLVLTSFSMVQGQASRRPGSRLSGYSREPGRRLAWLCTMEKEVSTRL